MPELVPFLFWFFVTISVVFYVVPLALFVWVKMGRMGWLLAERHFRLKFEGNKETDRGKGEA